MKWFPLRKSSGEPLALSMAGIKLGDRLLFVGGSDPVLIAQLAVKTGLTGRACAVDQSETVTAHAADVAAKEGALIETATAPWTRLPFDANAFDVAVVRDVLAGLDPALRGGCLDEVRRVLRPGGRCLVIDSAARGVSALVRRPAGDPDYSSPDSVVRALDSRGFRATRTLAQRQGLLFVEGVKPNV